MTRRFTLAVLALATVSSWTLMAHGPEKHKGKPTMGTVTSVSEGKIALKTKDGNKTVTVTDKTKILDGETPIELSNLKAGNELTVHGTTLASGVIVAEEIVRETEPSKGMKMGGMKGHAHEKMKEHNP